MNTDKTLIRYLSDDERFADLVNGYVGATVVHPKDLSERETATNIFPMLERKSKKDKSKTRYRDLFRKSAYGLNFAVIGIEEQTKIHYLMPIRNMGYDLNEYEKQIHTIRKKVRKTEGITGDEFLSGFRKTDKLHPCVTFVLFWGDEWDGALDLHELLDFEGIPAELQKFVNNYPIHLIHMKTFEHTDLFKTDLKQVFRFIQSSEDENALKKLINEDTAFQNLDEDAYDVIATFTKAKELKYIKRKLKKEGGKIDMCKAITNIFNEGKNEGKNEGIAIGKNAGIAIGKSEGIAIGKSEGIAIGKNEGIAIGKNERTKELIQKKLAKGKSISEIADALEEPVEVIEQFMKAM